MSLVLLVGCGETRESKTTSITSMTEASPVPSTDTTGTTTPRPTTPVPQSGKLVVNKGENAISNGVRVRLDSYRFDACGEARAGYTFLIAEVFMANDSNDTAADFSPPTWSVSDADGEDYTATISTPCGGRPINPSLNTGVSFQTRYAFELPGDARGLVLHWDGAPIFGVSKPQPIAIRIGE